jgi:hypothetical protein
MHMHMHMHMHCACGVAEAVRRDEPPQASQPVPTDEQGREHRKETHVRRVEGQVLLDLLEVPLAAHEPEELERA